MGDKKNDEKSGKKIVKVKIILIWISQKSSLNFCAFTQQR